MKITECAVVLMIKPSFGDEESIAYVQTRDTGKVDHVIRVMTKPARTLDKPDEEQRWKRSLSVKEAKRITDKLNSLTITGPPNGPYNGLDGTTWQLEISSGMTSLKLEWWSRLPEEWKSVWELVRVLQTLANYKTEPQWWQVWR